MGTTTHTNWKPEPLDLESLKEVYGEFLENKGPECWLVCDTIAEALIKDFAQISPYIPCSQGVNWYLFGVQIIPIEDIYAAIVPGLGLDHALGCTREQAGELLAAIEKLKRGDIKITRRD